MAVDTSVVVAAFAAWHERHAEAVAALGARPRVAAHTLLESYSVLTRLPAPLRMPAATVRHFLGREFSDPVRLTLAPDQQRALVDRFAGLGIEGGAVYDALIAVTAGAADATLLTLDRRALAVYGRTGAEARLIA